MRSVDLDPVAAERVREPETGSSVLGEVDLAAVAEQVGVAIDGRVDAVFHPDLDDIRIPPIEPVAVRRVAAGLAGGMNRRPAASLAFRARGRCTGC